MDKKELDFILQEGEGLKLEFKESLNNIDREIVAFANSEGGRIFLGISDDNKIKGIKVNNKLKSQIQDIANNCDPSIKIRLESIDNILIIHVEEGDDKPYKCKDGFFVRIGPNSQKMGRDAIVEMAISKEKTNFDEKICKDFDFDRDFDRMAFKEYLEKNNLYPDLNLKDILISLSLLKKENGKAYCNNACILFFAKNPQQFFLNAYLDCVLFKGNNKSEVIDRKIFKGTLFDQLNSAKEFVMKHLNLTYDFRNFERHDKYEIPIRAIEEALVNALMHRDYGFKGANISLFIYDDRIGIISPGGLPKGLDKKDFGRLSVRRNQIISEVFSKTPYVEKIGSGIRRMKNLMKQEGLPAPKFEMNGFFIVTFKRKTSVKTSVKSSVKSSVKILELIKENPGISIPTIAEQLGLTTRAIEKNITTLKKKGLLKRVGSAKGGHWETTK